MRYISSFEKAAVTKRGCGRFSKWLLGVIHLTFPRVQLRQKQTSFENAKLILEQGDILPATPIRAQPASK